MSKINQKHVLSAVFIVLVFSALSVAYSKNKSVSCPGTMDGQTLAHAELYDGPPSELASLAPDSESAAPEEQRWNLPSPYSKEGYYLGCFYGEDAEPSSSTKLPQSLKLCTSSADFSNIVCR